MIKNVQILIRACYLSLSENGSVSGLVVLYLCFKLPNGKRSIFRAIFKWRKNLDLIFNLIANTHEWQFFNEYGAISNDTQQEIFKLHQGQKIVFTVSGLSGKLIHRFICCLPEYITNRVGLLNHIFQFFPHRLLFMSVFIFNVCIDRGKFSHENILRQCLHRKRGLIVAKSFSPLKMISLSFCFTNRFGVSVTGYIYALFNILSTNLF